MKRSIVEVEVLFHFVFECVRIGLLSLLYGLAVHLVVSVFVRKQKLKKRLFVIGVFVLLALNRNMPWRDDGIGDYCRVPLGEGYTLGMVNCDATGALTGHFANYYVDKVYLKNGRMFFHVAYTTSLTNFTIIDRKSGKYSNYKSIQAFLSAGGDTSLFMKPMDIYDRHWSITRFLY